MRQVPLFAYWMAVGLFEWTTLSDREIHAEVTQREGFGEKAGEKASDAVMS
jgi:hypothetical protein